MDAYLINVNNRQEFTLEKSKDDKFIINNSLLSADVRKTGNHSYHVIINNKGYNIEILKNDIENKKLTILINGNKYYTHVKDKYDLLLSKLGINMVSKAVKNMKAPMPGLVLDVLVNPGDVVKSQQALMVLEAMKMENVLKAPADGIVKSVEVTKGKTVEKNQILINFE
jgi:biotin carboxyl carrier protein